MINDAEQLARLFHETYERLAPEFGWHSDRAIARAWDHLPSNNKRLMVATAEVVLTALHDLPMIPMPTGDE